MMETEPSPRPQPAQEKLHGPIRGLPKPCRWTWRERALVFVLSATSIWSLLADFYGLCSMRAFAVRVLIPATVLLIALAIVDQISGDGRLWRGCLIGATAGFVAAVAYDVFRLPFVFSRAWGLEAIVPPMNLFKVFPRFGAMILGEPIEQAQYYWSAHLIGWAYHFSNGMTFGVMYVAAIGDPRHRSWIWAVVMAVGLEIGMLFSPYPQFFSIPITTTFVVVTLAAHLIFGVVLGLLTRAWVTEQPPSSHGLG
jgi:hypothetical protein